MPPYQGGDMRLVVVLISVVALSGCSTLKQERLRVLEGGKGDIGSITTWSSDKASAVVIDKKVCMQLPTRVVNLGTDQAVALKGKGKNDGGQTTPKVDAELAAAGASGYRASSTLAVVATERTTFLSYSLFYLCQMAMNDSLKEESVKELVRFMVEESAKISPVVVSASVPIATEPKEADGKGGGGALVTPAAGAAVPTPATLNSEVADQVQQATGSK